MWQMVCLTVHIVYVDSQEVFDISLFSDIWPFCLNVIYDLPKFFLTWSFQNRIIGVQYIYGFYPVEHAQINIDFLTPDYWTG